MILMVCKLYVDKSKATSSLNLNTFLHELIKVKDLEKGAAFNNKPRREMFLKLYPIRTITLYRNWNNGLGGGERGEQISFFTFI